MGEAFLKSLKWCVLMTLIIGGAAALHRANETESAPPLMIAVLFFGGAYMMSRFWQDLPGKIMLSSLVVVVATGILAQFNYFPYWYYLYTGTQVLVGYFWIWAGLTVALGIPLMTFIFRMLDSDF